MANYMSTITFRESLKYGGRLFALWFAVTLVGGGLTVLGGYLAVPEVQSLITSGTGAVETATLAGGAILGLLGLSSLIVGNFALVYKFLADAVSKGIGARSAETVHTPSEPSDESTDSGPETAAESPDPTRTAPTTESAEPSAPAASEEDVRGPATVPASEQPTAETVRQPASHQDGQPTPAQGDAGGTDRATTDDSPVAEQSVQADRESAESTPQSQSEMADSTTTSEQTVDQQEQAPEQSPVSETQQSGDPGRERTAEEIAFGTDGQDQSPAEPQETGVTDDEWFDEDAQESETDRDAELSEEEPAEEVEKRNVETANDSEADPLSEQFEE